MTRPDVSKPAIETANSVDGSPNKVWKATSPPAVIATTKATPQCGKTVEWDEDSVSLSAAVLGCSLTDDSVSWRLQLKCHRADRANVGALQG